MIILDNLALFLRIVEKGGLAPAGRELGLSPASVSERLAALETSEQRSCCARPGPSA
jgi:DNA-binding transcriptional LysR family regulator